MTEPVDLPRCLVIETRDDVKWLKRAAKAILDHNRIVLNCAAEDDA